MPTPARPRPGPVHFLCLAALALVVFLPALWDAEFLNFDDPFFFGPDDPFAAASQTGSSRDAGPLTRIVSAWTGTFADAYLPITHTSLAIDRTLFGTSPLGPHLHNLLLHVLAAYMLALFATELGVSAARATMVAAGFLVHPALVESVAWVSGRKDLLSGLFAFIALTAVARHASDSVRGSRTTTAIVAVLATAIALYAKATAVVIPLLAVVASVLAVRAARRRQEEDSVMEAFLEPRGERGDGGDDVGDLVPAEQRMAVHAPLMARVGLLAVLFVITAVAGVHHTLVAGQAGTLAPVAVSAADRLSQVPSVYWHYLTVTVWPTGLNVLYPEVATLEAFREDSWWTTCLLLGLGTAIAFGARFRRTRRLAFGALMWFLALLPFNTFWPASSIAAADRYLYLAIPGAAFALLTVRGRVVPVLSLFVISLLALGAADRVRDFRNSDELWRSSLRRDDENAVAHLNYIEAIQGRATPAAEASIERHLERAAGVARYPQHALRAYDALARFHVARGRNAAALAAADKAVQSALKLDLAQKGAVAAQLDAILTAATLATVVGDSDLAEKRIEQAREVAPDHPVVLAYDAELLLGRALADLPEGVARVPDADPRRVRAAALLARAQAEGKQHYEVRMAAGRWAAATGRRMTALREFEAAIAIQPGLPGAYVAKTNVFVEQGLYEGAERAVREGLAATGKRDPQLVYYLAIVLKARGAEDEAIRYFEAFLVLRPNDVAARKALAELLAARAMRSIATLDPEVLFELGTRIRELEPFNAKGEFVQGVALRAGGDPSKALVLIENAAQALSDRADVQRVLHETVRDAGWQALRDGRRETGLKLLRRFVDEAADDLPKDAARTALRSAAHAERLEGETALGAGRHLDAIAAFESARDLDPADESVTMLLGLALFAAVTDDETEAPEDALARASKAFEEAETWARQAGQDPSLPVLYRMRCLQLEGRVEQAIEVGAALLAEPVGGLDPARRERVELLVQALRGG